MANITIFNNFVPGDRLVLTEAEYNGLKGRIATGLLTFYDRIDFGFYRETENNQLAIIGYKDSWVAVNVFFVDEWFAMDAGEFSAAMEEYISVKAHQYLASL